MGPSPFVADKDVFYAISSYSILSAASGYVFQLAQICSTKPEIVL